MADYRSSPNTAAQEAESVVPLPEPGPALDASSHSGPATQSPPAGALVHPDEPSSSQGRDAVREPLAAPPDPYDDPHLLHQWASAQGELEEDEEDVFGWGGALD